MSEATDLHTLALLVLELGEPWRRMVCDRDEENSRFLAAVQVALRLADKVRAPLGVRALLLAADEQREALRASVEAEALPLMQAAWEASPGRFEMFGQLVRVGCVERRSEARGVFDLVWLEYVAYRPFSETPDVLLQRDGRWLLRVGIGLCPLSGVEPDSESNPGVVWLREIGMEGPNGTRVAWIHCGINQKPGVFSEGRVDHMVAGDCITQVIYPAAVAWLHANGGPRLSRD